MKKKYTKDDYFRVASAMCLWVQDETLFVKEACKETKASSTLFMKIWGEASHLLEREISPSEKPSSLAIQLACEKAGLA
jgi:hypothetical protein